jgi:hypothetical protein
MRPSRNCVRPVIVSLFLIAIGSPAAAQGVPRGEFSAGWKLLRAMDAFLDADETIPAGWYADVAGNVNDIIAIAVEVAGAYKSFGQTVTVPFGQAPVPGLPVPVNVTADVKLHTFMGGIRFGQRNRRVAPFGEVLFGVAHGSAGIEGSATVLGRTISVRESESSNEFAFDVGAGINIKFTDRIGMRVTGSYLRVGAGDGGNGLRLGAGIVVPF